MHLNLPTLASVLLVAFGGALSAPVLYRGFSRRGKGVKYESNFLIQRAPQLASGLAAVLITFSFLGFNHILKGHGVAPILTLAPLMPRVAGLIVAWIGVALLLCGLIFMIGGWYSLGECFSTDAELLDGQTVRKNGLLKYVMHPAYSGIIQSLLGASIAALSPASALTVIFLVAPLWLKRAKYEEELLIHTFGQGYMDYAQELGWRRLVPSFFPIGV